MRDSIRYETILPSGHHFIKWSELRPEEQETTITNTGILVDYLTSHPNHMVTYEEMNKIGLNHLYKFQIDNWNDRNPHLQITVTEKGAVFEKKNN